MEIYKGKYGIGTYVKLKKDFPYYIHTYVRQCFQIILRHNKSLVELKRYFTYLI